MKQRADASAACGDTPAVCQLSRSFVPRHLWNVGECRAAHTIISAAPVGRDRAALVKLGPTYTCNKRRARRQIYRQPVSGGSDRLSPCRWKITIRSTAPITRGGCHRDPLRVSLLQERCERAHLRLGKVLFTVAITDADNWSNIVVNRILQRTENIVGCYKHERSIARHRARPIEIEVCLIDIALYDASIGRAWHENHLHAACRKSRDTAECLDIALENICLSHNSDGLTSAVNSFVVKWLEIIDCREIIRRDEMITTDARCKSWSEIGRCPYNVSGLRTKVV